tara:strand:+ start:315 stop:992 length:678 start_codon:yes stop_codon:yes gene_type:complete
LPNHEEIHKAYISQDESVLKSAGLIALNNAYRLLKKADIYGKVLEMENLDSEFRKQDKELNNGVGTFEENSFKLFEVGVKRSKCYNGFADDLIMFAAFEQYINSCLLRSGFVVHVIDKDKSKTKSLGNKQKRKPINISEVTVGTVFRPNSLNASLLTSDKYLKLLNPSDTIKRGLESLKSRRNKTHFDSQINSVSYYDPSFFEAFKFIQNVTEYDHNECYSVAEL